MRGVHGYLGGLGGGPSYEHYLLGGLAIRFSFLWGLGEVVLRFLDPEKLYGIFRGLYTELGTESVIQNCLDGPSRA